MRIKIKTLHSNRTSITHSLLAVGAFILCFENTIIETAFPMIKLLPFFRAFLTLFLFIIIGIKNRLRKDFLLIFLMIIEIYVVTLYYRGQIVSAIINISDSLFVLLVLMVLTNENVSELTRTFDVWKWLLMILLIIDLYTIIRFPNGLYFNSFFEKHWFLGYKTQRMTYVFPMVFFYSFCSIQKKGRIDLFTFIATVLSIIDTYLCSASIATITLLFCFAGLVLINMYSDNSLKWNNIISKVLRYKIWIPAIIIVTFIITWIRWEKLIGIISESLGKSMTLSNRTGLWESVVSMITKRPFFGYGFLTLNQYASYIYYTNTHCSILTILVNGGFFAFTVYMIYIYYCFRGINNSKQAIIVSVFIYSIFLLGIGSSAFIFTPYCFVPFYCLRFCKSTDDGQGIKQIIRGL